MREDHARKIVTRAFVATGKDGTEGLIEYIDRLERGILWMDKKIMGRKNVRPRSRLEDAMREHDDRP